MSAKTNVLTKETIQNLFTQATEVLQCAYCPYSKFPVGAALLCRDGTVVTALYFPFDVLPNLPKDERFIGAPMSPGAPPISYSNRGCNVENASFGGTICAERVAVTKAVSQGRRDFVAVAVVCKLHELAYPCGLCRQVMTEFGDIQVFVGNENEWNEKPVRLLADLMPHSFGPQQFSSFTNSKSE